MTILIDTSFMLAVAWKGDINHPIARAAMREITEERDVSSAVLPELFYMLATCANYNAAVRVFHTLQSNAFHIQGITAADMVRMEQIMLQYQDNRFDYVDVSIMALAERLNIADIYTFDRRDFAAFHPSHRAYLRLLP